MDVAAAGSEHDGEEDQGKEERESNGHDEEGAKARKREHDTLRHASADRGGGDGAADNGDPERPHRLRHALVRRVGRGRAESDGHVGDKVHAEADGDYQAERPAGERERDATNRNANE